MTTPKRSVVRIDEQEIGTISLWLEAGLNGLDEGNFAYVREQLLPIAPIELPACITRELKFAERRCNGTTDKLLAIRLLWLLADHEQQSYGAPEPIDEFLSAEPLWLLWTKACVDAAYRADLERDGIAFDFIERAIKRDNKWTFIGDDGTTKERIFSGILPAT